METPPGRPMTLADVNEARSWVPLNEIAAMGPLYKINTCPMCIEMAKLNQARVSTFCEHTPEQLRKYQENQAQTSASNEAQADRTVTKKCKGCTILGGTKKSRED